MSDGATGSGTPLGGVGRNQNACFSQNLQICSGGGGVGPNSCSSINNNQKNRSTEDPARLIASLNQKLASLTRFSC